MSNNIPDKTELALDKLRDEIGATMDKILEEMNELSEVFHKLLDSFELIHKKLDTDHLLLVKVMEKVKHLEPSSPDTSVEYR